MSDNEHVSDEEMANAGATGGGKKKKNKKKKKTSTSSSTMIRGVYLAEDGKTLVWDAWGAKTLGKTNCIEYDPVRAAGGEGSGEKKIEIKEIQEETSKKADTKSKKNTKKDEKRDHKPPLDIEDIEMKDATADEKPEEKKKESEDSKKNGSKSPMKSPMKKAMKFDKDSTGDVISDDPKLTKNKDEEPKMEKYGDLEWDPTDASKWWQQPMYSRRRRQKTYVFSGTLRPAPIRKQISFPDRIVKPDYATHPEGQCISEQEWPEREIPVMKDPKEIEMMRQVCKYGREVLDIASKYVCKGVTGDEIDRIVTQACLDRNIYPSPLNYYNFPKSVCVSPNEVICHGIPDLRAFQEGDIINLDISVYYQGYHADLNETFFIGKCDDASEKLVKTAYNCLLEAAKMIKPGTLYRSVGNTITKIAHEAGCSVVNTYCGHGIGKLFHGPPSVPHYKGSKAPGLMKPGHIFTIEPMINLGLNNSGDGMWPDDWTAVTLDGARSSQFEHTFLVTEKGYEVLTARDGKSKGEPMPEYNREWFQR